MGKTAKNYIYNLSYQLLLIAVPLITIPYLSRTLGSNGVGLYGYANSIVTYFSLFGCLGINIYGQREIAYRKDSEEKISSCFWELVIIRLSSSLLFGVALFGFSYIYTDNIDLRTQLHIQIITLLANAIDISWYYQGLEDFKKTAIRSIVFKIVSVILIFIFVKTQNDLWKYSFIMCGCSLLGNLLLWFQIKRNLVKVPIKQLKFKRHFLPITLLFLPQIASSLHTVLDKTMIGFMTDNDEVAYYEQAQKILNLMLVICTSLNTVLMPKIAYLKETGQEEKIFNSLSLASRFVCLVSIPMTIGIYLISDDFVPIFFGPGYDGVIPVLRIMSILVLIIGLSNTFGIQYLVPTGNQKQFNISVFIGTFINVSLNVLLIIFYRAKGAAIATVIAEIFITAYQLLVVKKKNPSFSIFQYLLRYLSFALCMFVLLTIEKRLLKPGFIRMLTMILSGVFIYSLIVLLSKDSIIQTIFLSIKKKVVRKTNE